MHNIEDRYDVGALVGKGSSAKVFLGQDKATGEQVAIKMVPQAGAKHDEPLMREAVIIRMAGEHPGILHFRGLFVLGNMWAIVTEFLGGGELFERVSSQRSCGEMRAKH